VVFNSFEHYNSLKHLPFILIYVASVSTLFAKWLRKGLCFIYKEPWGLDHSCLGDIEELTGVDQEEIPFDFQDEDSSLDGYMGSYKDSSKEHG